jgi:arabinofuranosyltransferase
MSAEDKPENKLIILALLAFYALIIIRNAWVCDDAYISFRTIDNFIHGYGLTWNISERVQAFTHPLWVFVLSPLYAITGEIYFTSLLVSLALSLGAAALFAFKLADSWRMAAIGILILALSDAFIDYSTSGLENPLTYLILVLFMYFYFRRNLTVHSLFALCLLAALAAVNRQDVILIYLPMLVYAFWQVRGRKALVAVAAGFSPLILWEIFSMLYFGFPVPNTAYAKLHTGVASSLMARQGLAYLLNSIKIDPLTILVIGLALLVPFAFRIRKQMAASLGLLFVLVYIIRIGGCFMSGRHFAAPLLFSVVLLAQFPFRLTKNFMLAATGIVLMMGLAQEFSPLYTRYDRNQNYEPVHLGNGITDERKFYFSDMGLVNYIRRAPHWPIGGWINEGLYDRREKVRFHASGNIGMLGFYAGPNVHILDLNALADPLLARLPINNKYNPAIGHFARKAPPGYEATLREGENKIDNPSLAAYYDTLSMITRGNIFSLRRLWVIARFNLGYYDHLVDDYVKSDMIVVNLSEISQPRPRGYGWDGPGNIVINASALEVKLDSLSHAENIEISHDNNDIYRIVFLQGDRERGNYTIPSAIFSIEGLDVTSFDIPIEASEKGFDRIRIYPESGDGMYSVGHITLSKI